MKILSNASVQKLREYSRSYGSLESVDYPFIIDNEKTITCLNEFGNAQRTFKKGTKLLISFEGTEISERSFKIRTSKALKALRIEQEKQKELVSTQINDTLLKFNKQKDVILSKVREKFNNGLSCKEAKIAAFYVTNKFMNGAAHNTTLANLLRNNI